MEEILAVADSSMTPRSSLTCLQTVYHVCSGQRICQMRTGHERLFSRQKWCQHWVKVLHHSRSSLPITFMIIVIVLLINTSMRLEALVSTVLDKNEVQNLKKIDS